jgi:hypothetical protein
VEVLSMYMSKPWKEHWTTVKRVFRYLCGTFDYVIFYQGIPRPHKEIYMQGFIDAEWVGYLNPIRFTSGYVFNLFGGANSWMRKKRVVVTIN